MLKLSSPAEGHDGETGRYRCGTLTYTKAGLFTLFAWMLWGDFCFTLMEVIWPTVLPLVMKSEGAPNFVIAMAVTTIPNAMNFILNPIISTASDRYRGKRGRRIPFLLFSAPFITFFLILMGFSRELGGFLHAALGGMFPSLTSSMATVGLICILIVCFRFFELFVGTVFWYLFNDVVPTAFMGRFLGFFRVIGGLAGAFFNLFLLKYAESHTSLIFLGSALLYGTAFLLLSLNVKEGEYPAPQPMTRGKKFSVEVVMTFFRECFSQRIVRLVYLSSSLGGVNSVMVVFQIFMAFSLGLSIEEFGKIAGIAALLGTALMYPIGVLVDRFHPLRVLMVSQAGFAVATLMQCMFLFIDFPRETAFWLYACLVGISIPMQTANVAATLPMFMRLFPREQFGQFCSANAMCASLSAVAAGVLAGLYLDVIKGFFPDSGDYYYRFVPVWTSLCAILIAVVTILIFREWKKLGGDTRIDSL